MWKESYRIGVPQIDAQHYTLFLTADRLFKTIRDDQTGRCGETYGEIIAFMKQYVARHFADEEIYQAAIGYAGLEAHRKEHRGFTRTVLDYDRRFRESGYALALVKQFAGTLLAWLIYHVAKEDQKYAHPEAAEQVAQPARFLDCFAQSAGEVLRKMAGAQLLSTRRVNRLEELPAGDIAVRLEFVGDAPMTAQFVFPKALAFQLLQNMTFQEVMAVDELVCSAVAEIVNIASGNVATMLQARDLSCDIKPPVLTLGGLQGGAAPGICVHTDAGELGIALYEA